MVAHDIRAIAQQFQLPGQFISAQPYGNGYINDTYAAVYQVGDQTRRYIHQRINHDIFKDPVSLMENVWRVTRHLQQKLADLGLSEPQRRSLTLIPTHDGALYYQDGAGNFWRTYDLIEGAQSYDAATSPEQAYQAGKAFGQFQRLLADLPPPRLIETIPDFHHTSKRFAALERAIEADVRNRARLAKPEIEFALSREAMTGVLLDLQQQGQLIEQITHNDTKINNVLFDLTTGEGICVIDLDTVMPGLALYDIGDMIRTATCPVPEDERDLTKVRLEVPIFEALVRGYMEAAGDFLSQTDKDHLIFSGKLITFEMGIRFLADYLAGDTYYKIQRPDHNLDRCRTQLALIRSIEAQESQLSRIVETLSAN